MNKLRENAGFIYVDLLTSIVIISVALVSVVGLFIMIGKTNMVNDSEKAATALARMQVNCLKQYEGQMLDRLNPCWRQIGSEVYMIPPNAKPDANINEGKYKYRVSSRVLKGLIYTYKSGKSFVDPAEYDGKSSVDTTDNVSPESEMPDAVVHDLNIIPVAVCVTWQENINGSPVQRKYEIVHYYLSSPEI